MVQTKDMAVEVNHLALSDLEKVTEKSNVALVKDSLLQLSEKQQPLEQAFLNNIEAINEPI